MSETDVLDELLDCDVKVFLAARNIALRGVLVGHDANAVVLEDGTGRTVIYKPQIISITHDETETTDA